MGIFTKASESGYDSLKKICIESFKNFKRYGDAVLAKDFIDADDKELILKELFIENRQNERDCEFENQLKNFWGEHYRVIISKVEDLDKLPEKAELHYYAGSEYNATESIVVWETLFDIFRKYFERASFFDDHSKRFCYARDGKMLYVIESVENNSCNLVLAKKIPLTSLITD